MRFYRYNHPGAPNHGMILERVGKSFVARETSDRCSFSQGQTVMVEGESSLFRHWLSELSPMMQCSKCEGWTEYESDEYLCPKCRGRDT